jgi:gamma-glutamyltranspeptidase/glutathione hydrolase
VISPPHHEEAAPLDSGPLPSHAGVAVSPHHLASRAGVAILHAGGNAVDAAVAVNAVLGVVAPDTCGPGGDLFALIHGSGRTRPLALNASGRAGSGADAAALRAAGHDELPPLSPSTITVPGCVDGWEALIATEGNLSLGDVLAPAIELATEGFATSRELASSLTRLEERLAGQGSAAPLYPSRRPPDAGDILRRPRLAETLRELQDGGRDAFYLGEVGEAVTKVTGGVITPDDLARGQAAWVDPIGIEAFGRTGWTVPPNSQGYLALAAAWAFERLTDATDPDDPAYQHALIESYRMFAWERDDLVADPDGPGYVGHAVLDPERLLARTNEFDAERAGAWPAPPRASGGTAFMCTRDGEGTAVALIQSNYHGIGTGLSAGDTGVFLHDRGGGFNLTTGHPNELAPGRRPLHTLSPTLWTVDGRLSAVIGTRGGEFQPQYLAQAAARLFRTGTTPAETQASSRWQVQSMGKRARSEIAVEPGLPGATLAELRARGHTIRETDPWQVGWGPVSIIMDTGDAVIGAADPRVSTASAVHST